MRRLWKKLRYQLEWVGLLAAPKLVPLPSRKACFRLALALGALMSILDRQGRKVALANLEAAFGDQMSIWQRRKLVRKSFQHFARTMLDLLWSPRLTRENFSCYIELENFDELVRSAGPERSVLVACYHYSNFEWLGLACGFLDFAGTIISQEFKNSLLDPIFKEIREQSGHEFIPRERGIVRLYKTLRRKGRTALLVDLTVPPTEGAVAIDCFGLKTSVTSAHAWLHRQTGVPIVPAHCEPLPHGRYRLVFHRAIDPPRDGFAATNKTQSMSDQHIAQACWDSFEPYVRKNPAPWLWMYKHWRYLPANAERPYPFYANFYRPFEDMLNHETAGSVQQGNESNED